MSRLVAALLAILVASLLPVQAIAANGDIIARERFVPGIGYEAWFARAFAPSEEALDPAPDLAKARAYYTPALYQALVEQTEVSAERIVYESDHLRIAGIIVLPKHMPGKLPVILWCRGGIGTVGGITLGDVLIMSNWARAGYVVIASNYRGGPRSEGHDEDGGADVDDVEALVPLARHLPQADADRLFLYGQSRGGMMVYRALADGVKARAAVVNSGVSDLSQRDRPDAVDMDALAREAMPDYAAEAARRFCRRSAICWPEKLAATPLLLLHGDADWRVPVGQATALTARLKALHAPVTLHVFEGGAHVWLDQRQAAIDRDILAFFANNNATRECQRPSASPLSGYEVRRSNDG